MKKIYKIKEERNEEELRTNKASYETLVNMFFSDLVLCNNIIDIDFEMEDIIGSQFDYESEIYKEIYQYYITNISEYSIESLRDLMNENNDDSIILLYSNILDCYVLAVDHYGTSWSYVNTNIELTENIEEI